VGRTVQWLFRRPGDSPKEGYVQGVVSASRGLAAKGRDEVLRIIESDVRSILPAARDAQVLRSVVVTERHATFCITPGVDELRPTQRTPVERLFLAGDYTQTGWPATMEGAVRSGYLAAEAILQSVGRPTSLLQPPLPRSRLARLLLPADGSAGVTALSDAIGRQERIPAVRRC
jgi:hypothetical protein